MPVRFFYYDAVVVFLLACATACRGRLFSAHATGSCLLGLFCALAWLLVRDCLFWGCVRFLNEQIVFACVGGAIIGTLVGHRLWSDRFFFYTDRLGLALAVCWTTLLALASGKEASWGLMIGFMLGVGPGLLRDVALGDTALFVEEKWYATSAILGSMVSIVLLLTSTMYCPPEVPPDLPALGGGVVLAMLLGSKS